MTPTSQEDQVTYDPTYYDLVVQDSLRAARQIVPAVVSLVNPWSVIDVGCGIGTWLSVSRERGLLTSWVSMVPLGRGKGTSMNSTCLTPKPLASNVYVHVPEAPSPRIRPISVMSLFLSLFPAL